MDFHCNSCVTVETTKPVIIKIHLFILSWFLLRKLAKERPHFCGPTGKYEQRLSISFLAEGLMRWFGCQYSLVMKLQPADCHLNTECCLKDVGTASLAQLYGNNILLQLTQDHILAFVFIHMNREIVRY